MAALSLLAVAGCISDPIIPQTLQVPAGQKFLLRAYGKGVQIYTCDSNSNDPSKLVWKLKGPEAALFDPCGNLIGSHYSGPTWENDRDASQVVGEILRSNPSPLTNAIPWLLIRAKSTQGSGLFHDVTYIQRVNTRGGLPPLIVHNDAHLGEEVRVRYTAEYFFYRTEK